MTASNFLACFNETEKWEGGFVDNPHDPGGATMAGVTQAVYTAWLAKQGRPNAPVKDSSAADRQAIYRTGYWNAVRGDELYAGLDLVMTDTAWGSGPVKAVKLLQEILGFAGSEVDGKFGPKTMAKLERVPASLHQELIESLCQARMEFFKSLSTWQYFGAGWTNRLNGIRAKALEMNKDAPPPLIVQSQPPLEPAPTLPAPPTAGSQETVIVPKHTGIGDPPAPPAPPAQSPTERVAAAQAHVGQLTDAPEHLSVLGEIEAWLKRVFG